MCWTGSPRTPSRTTAKVVEGKTRGQVEGSTARCWQDASMWSIKVPGVFKGQRDESSCWVCCLWQPGELVAIIDWVQGTYVWQSLAVANKLAFRNCLVAMCPNTNKVDIPSSQFGTLVMSKATTKMIWKMMWPHGSSTPTMYGTGTHIKSSTTYLQVLNWPVKWTMYHIGNMTLPMIRGVGKISCLETGHGKQQFVPI